MCVLVVFLYCKIQNIDTIIYNVALVGRYVPGTCGICLILNLVSLLLEKVKTRTKVESASVFHTRGAL